MSGNTRQRDTATGTTTRTYYQCPHDTANPRHVAANPDHSAGLRVREDHLLAAIRQFLDERILGPDRAALLAATLPATDAAAAARRDTAAAAIRQRLRQIDAAENAHAREIEALATTNAPAAAITALRTRIIARFTELEEERAAITTRLTALETPATAPQDPASWTPCPCSPASWTTHPPPSSSSSTTRSASSSSTTTTTARSPPAPSSPPPPPPPSPPSSTTATSQAPTPWLI
jgi:hypothetical protein